MLLDNDLAANEKLLNLHNYGRGLIKPLGVTNQSRLGLS